MRRDSDGCVRACSSASYTLWREPGRARPPGEHEPAGDLTDRARQSVADHRDARPIDCRVRRSARARRNPARGSVRQHAAHAAGEAADGRAARAGAQLEISLRAALPARRVAPSTIGQASSLCRSGRWPLLDRPATPLSPLFCRLPAVEWSLGPLPPAQTLWGRPPVFSQW